MKASHLEYLYSLDRLGIKPGLERMEAIMEVLDHPERKFKSIHISGTNGKGSVAAMIESVLRASGKRTGLYTSPDIYSFHERIRVDGVPISDTDLADLIWEVKEVAEKNNVQLTFFESTTAICYLYFARQNLDIAVVEVGMGGLLDATNVITPLVSVITNIGLDHQEFLGDTKEEIAQEKAGIIKPDVPCVAGTEEQSVLAVIEDVCRKNKAPLIKITNAVLLEDLSSSQQEQQVRITKPWKGEVTLPLLGKHQVKNLQVALSALAQLPFELSLEKVQRGIQITKWEGRLDIVSKKPMIIVDGAHNADGMNALCDYLEKISKRDVLIFGLKQGKKIDEAVQRLINMFDHIIVSEGNYQPQEANDLAKRLARQPRVTRLGGPPASAWRFWEAVGRGKSGEAGPAGKIEICNDIRTAIKKSRELAGDNGLIVIAGSLYLVGDALGVLRKPSIHLSG